MPIEFRCSQCGKLLRTGDDTAGRQAQCPNCGTIGVVPGPAESGGPALQPLAPLNAVGASASGTPFGTGPAFENPYRSPAAAASGLLPGEPDPTAATRVAGPAIALIVVAILNIVTSLGLAGVYTTMLVLITTGRGGAFIPPGNNANEMILGCGIWIGMGIIGLLLGIVLLIGARKMNRMEGYVFAVIASIVAMVPCTSPCCLLGLPFGIWALVVLNDSSVKAAFRS